MGGDKQKSDNTFSNNHPVEKVLDANLLELLGIKDASDEDKHDIYEKAFQIIENRVLARIFEVLSGQVLEDWKKIPEEDKIARFKFLQDRGINLLKLYTLEAVIYKSEIASLTHRLEDN